MAIYALNGLLGLIGNVGGVLSKNSSPSSNGMQTEVEALIVQVGDLLVAKGLLDEGGHPVVGDYPAAEASALWNYIYIVFEDGSLGVHNSIYTKAMLEASIAAMLDSIQ